jgi:phosphoglycolate phosphatase
VTNLDYLLCSNITLAVFDLDGTLVNSDEAISWCFNEALQEMGFQPKEISDIACLIGIPLGDMFAEFLPPEKTAEAVQRYRRHYKTVCVERTTLLEGAREILFFMHERDIQLAVATNKPLGFTRDILSAMWIDEFFAVVAGPENASQPKPDPGMLYYVMSQLGKTAADTIYVGDSLTDCYTAQAAGVRMFAVATGAHTKDEMAMARPFWLGDSLVELKDYLKGNKEV